MTHKPSSRVELSRPFLRAVQRLSKKYRSIRNDVQQLIDSLEHGDTPGDRIQGVGYVAYKVRLKSSDLTKGKRGGFRVIYYLRVGNVMVLLTIYLKTEQSDVGVEEVKRLIEEYIPPE
jgi:mRNA-degrading endonuclease RelE of RelBE toxin-antitoxin system